jgi:hypothetical protein
VNSKQGIDSPRRGEAPDQVAEPPLRFVIAAVALGMIVGALLGGGPVDQQDAASIAAIAGVE